MKESKWSETHFRALSLLLLIGALSNDSSAAPGDVDLSFDAGIGINGRVSAIAVQPDGKLLVGGYFPSVRGLLRTNVARLNADGSGDPTFNPSVRSDEIHSLALQSDGKMVVGGYFSTYVYDPTNGAEYFVYTNFLTRLDANGTRDTGFEETAQENTVVYAVAVQPDGKVLIGGYFTAFKGANRNGIARLNANGSLDDSFNPGTGANGWVNSVVVQSDGKVLIGGGFTSFDGTNRGGIARLNANGSLDNSFNPGTGVEGSVSSVVLQPDGKVLIGGYFTAVNGTARNGMARLNSNGSLDGSFDPATAGVPLALQTIAYPPPVLQPDGKILVGGYARLNADGSRDSSFNPGPPPYGVVRSLALQPDGKVLLGGDLTTIHGASRKAIARLNADGGLDTSFHPGRDMAVSVSSVVLQPDGKVLDGDVFTFINGTNRYASTRLNADGSLDGMFISNTNFRPDLTVVIQYADCDDSRCRCDRYTMPVALLAQADGKVLIGGQTVTFMECSDGGGDIIFRHFLARFNADGSLDSSFGMVIGNRDSGSVNALAVQPDGKVLVGGSFFSINGTNRRGIARLNANGSLDSSFNPGTGANGNVSSVALQPDGKVLVGGSFTSVNDTNRNNLARLNANGSLDSSFNPGTGVNGTVSSVALQPDGKVLIGGSFTSVNGTNRNNIARLNVNGSLDNSFNPGTGPNAKVSSIALQPDGKVLIGGDFTTVNGVVRLQVARLYGDFFASSLSIARSNAFVILSWPVSDTNFRLEENTNLSLPNGWSAVAGTRSTNNSSISVALPATGSSKFFRLSLP